MRPGEPSGGPRLSCSWLQRRPPRPLRCEVVALLVRGRAAGLPVTEMAKLLGLSRQWTTHLLDCDRAHILQAVHENYHLVRRGSAFVQTRRNVSGGGTSVA